VDVVPQGLARLLLAALEVLGVSGEHVHPLEVLDEDLLELHPTSNAVGPQNFEPCSNMLPNTNEEVLDDEVVVIRPSSLAGKSEVFLPYSRVRFPGVLGDVARWSEARREWRFLDAVSEGPWDWAVQTRAPITVPVARSTSSPRGRLVVLPLGVVSLSHIHGGPVNIGAAAGQLLRVDDATCIVVGPEPAAHKGVPCGGRRFKMWCSRDVATHPGWKLLPLMD
jgi:hypothetical protein